jgi:large subunit ribosomal protein L24
LPQGGIVEKEAAIHASNLQVVCLKCGKPTRIAHKTLASGKKTRVCKKCGEILDKEK